MQIILILLNFVRASDVLIEKSIADKITWLSKTNNEAAFYLNGRYSSHYRVKNLKFLDVKTSVLEISLHLCQLEYRPSCEMEKIKFELFWNRFKDYFVNKSSCKLSMFPSGNPTLLKDLLSSGIAYSTKNARLYLEESKKRITVIDSANGFVLMNEVELDMPTVSEKIKNYCLKNTYE